MEVTLLLILSCNNSFKLNITSCCESSLLSSFPLLGLWTFLHEEHFPPNACFVLSARVWRRLLPTSPGPAEEDSSVLKVQWCEPERCSLLCLVWGQGTCSCSLWGQTCCCFSAAMSLQFLSAKFLSVSKYCYYQDTCLQHRRLCMEK